MGSLAGDGKKFVRAVSQKSYLVGTLVRMCRCATSWSDLDLTFDLAVVTLSLKILSGLYLKTVRCRKLILGRDIGYWMHKM